MDYLNRETEMEQSKYDLNFCISTYILTLPGQQHQLNHIRNEFAGKDEFELNFIEVSDGENTAMEMWQSLVEVCRIAIDADEEVVIICRAGHTFTKDYTKRALFEAISDAAAGGAKILLGGLNDFGQAIPISSGQFWIDSFRDSSFMVLFRPVLEQMLVEVFGNENTIDESLSEMTSHKIVLFPCISFSQNLHPQVVQGNDHLPAMVDMGQKRLSRLAEIARLYSDLLN